MEDQGKRLLLAVGISMILVLGWQMMSSKPQPPQPAQLRLDSEPLAPGEASHDIHPQRSMREADPWATFAQGTRCRCGTAQAPSPGERAVSQVKT